MKSFACYCQKCRAANLPGDEACAKCGTPLMLMVVPQASRNQSVWAQNSAPEHLLERVSHLELRLVQLTDRFAQSLDLMGRQSEIMQKQQLLIETLVGALNDAGVIDGDGVSKEWREKQQQEERKTSEQNRRAAIRKRILNDSNGTKLDLFASLIGEGFKLIESADEKQGLRTLERASALDQNNFALLAFLGTHYFRHDKRALARDYLTRAHRVSAQDATINLLLGVVLTDDGEFDAAKKLLAPLSEKSGFAANFALGMIYAKENQMSDALIVFKRALQAKQKPETFYLVGAACADLKRDKAARTHLQKAVELDANFADAWFTLSAVYLRADDEKAAKEALENALAARDAGAQATTILRNPQKFLEINGATLLFSRLAHVSKNIVNSSSPRLVKLLREEIDRLIDNQFV